ncbi:pyridine nucleotide-disulfide oxidoreductase [Pseudoclavibacter endophyticus]|uniref:ferredoxin--NADP(+) reductase n=1 Tax=Pseudoclavibacter endophyticus TaxID=1778590 RepID=A0A6H9WBJ1_9MICO|nr:FAD-dependent oxidoreductase [Pseudoclavibacter endophyticus]KAB1648033.1 pyridine nucleotide-disulfide oxidoreductase [Pseudoclavibacter endophyticus]GGA69162.1 pyridine nucleotide-disulfide oxidoreductase [Pseudoclavibacter endophyticus]
MANVDTAAGHRGTLRLAIVGAGPAGIYAADILLKSEHQFDISIDLFDRLPAPYGLVRYGVAPDHPRIKGIIGALREVLDTGRIRIFGNVDFGTDLTLDDVKRHYNAVIFATGAVRDADLDIPGNDAEGSFGAADFVNWYDGHPDVPRDWPLDATSVAVIGNGNVALDVARVLAKDADDMLSTEIPDNVYEGLRAKAVTDVHVFGRRGPAQVKFTPLELRELGEVPGVDVVVYEEDFGRDPEALQLAETNKQLMVIGRITRKWREKAAAGENTASRRIHLHFYAKPHEVLTENGAVSGLRVERTEPDGAGGVRGMGEFRDYPVQQVYRAVGYFGSRLPGVPFDERRGVIPNREGQVVDDDGQLAYGMYTTGWIKRGPVGLIGHTKSDAMETIGNLVRDQRNWWSPAEPEEAAIVRLLDERGVRWTDLAGWHRLDEHERGRGAVRERERIKVVERDEMLRVSRDER